MEYLFQQYQSPMGKVKLKAVAEQGYGLDVSIPYGKGKERRVFRQQPW